MSNIHLFAVVLVAGSVAACKIDSLPQRTSHDGATEAGKGAGLDSGAGLDGGEVGSSHFDAGGPVDVGLGYDAANDISLDSPLVPIDASRAPGVEAGPEAAASVESKSESGPEPRPEPGSDAGTVATVDVGSVTVVDGGTDIGPDTSPDVGPDVPITAVLTVVKTGMGGGTVTSSPAGIACGSTCLATIAVGGFVTLTPTADETSTFTGWSGACSGTGTCTVTVDAAKSVTANFDPLQEGLNVAKIGAGNGLVTSSPAGITCGSNCLSSFVIGTSVTLTATPDAASFFVGWSGACGGSGNTCTIVSEKAMSITATFVKVAGAACAATGECQAGLTCLDGVCCTQSTCPLCHNCGTGGACNIAVVNADDTTGLTCLGTNSCDATGACKNKNGQTCSLASDCVSGSCTDSRCCSQSCGTCQACTGAGGTCVAVTSADDPNTCTGNNTCDASGACKKKPGQACTAGMDCASGNCLDGVCCTQSSCPQCQNCGSSGACTITISGADDTTGATCNGANTCDATGACKARPSTINSGLVAYYPFNGNADDESGNGRGGTVNGATPAMDRFGNANRAYSFDGISNTITLPFNCDVFDNSFAISVWFYQTKEIVVYTFGNWTYQGLVGADYWADRGIMITTGGNGSGPYLVSYQVNNQDISPASFCDVDATLSPIYNAWHNAVLSYDGENSKAYLDGVLVSGCPFSGPVSRNTINFEIGRWTYVSYEQKYYFGGRMDDIRFYNRALSQQEIQALYTEGQ